MAAYENHFDVIFMPAMRHPVTPFPAVPAGDLHLLVVSDDRVLRQQLVTLAKRSGYNSINVCESSEALTIVLARRPDLVIVDVPISIGESMDFVRWLRGSTLAPQPYILLVTSWKNDQLLADAYEIGVDEVICKPFRPRLIALRLRTGHRIIGLQREIEYQREELQRYSEALRRSNRRLRELALTDELTGLPNRLYAMEQVKLTWDAATRNGSPLSCVVVDLDGLSEINELHGYERGDVVLKTVAAVLRERAAAHDFVCRISGDEFLIIRPEAPLANSVGWAKALVSVIDRFGIAANGSALGLSLGVSERHPTMADPQELLSLADRNMCRARQSGKNQVCAEGTTEAATVR